MVKFQDFWMNKFLSMIQQSKQPFAQNAGLILLAWEFHLLLKILCIDGVQPPLAGYEFDEGTFEKIFKCIYASFGAATPYTVFPDSQSFLTWLCQKGFKVGIVSNAEYRHQDVWFIPSFDIKPGRRTSVWWLKYNRGFTICSLALHRDEPEFLVCPPLEWSCRVSF